MTLAEPASPSWHALSATEAAGRLEVDPDRALPSAEAARRRDRDGPNLKADSRLAVRAHTREHGEDDPEIAGWTRPAGY